MARSSSRPVCLRVVRADEATTVVHFGPWDPNPPTTGAYGAPTEEGRTVHVVGPGGTYALIQPGRASKFYADSTFPTSRITLLYTSREDAYLSSPHSHSEDEIIYLLSGEIQVGQTIFSPAMRSGSPATVAIASRAARMVSGSSTTARDASYMSAEKDKPPFLEGGAVHDFNKVMDLR